MRKSPISLTAVLFLLVAALSVHPSAHASQRRMRKYKPPPPMAQVVVTVLRAEDGKPLQNVAVVFHPREGDKDDGNMELKTNKQGQASLNIVPVGSQVLVQVIATGYRTFGKLYDVPSAKKSITIKLLPPDQQYSVYAKWNQDSDVQTNTPQTQMGHAAPHDSPLLAPAEKKH